MVAWRPTSEPARSRFSSQTARELARSPGMTSADLPQFLPAKHS